MSRLQECEALLGDDTEPVNVGDEDISKTVTPERFSLEEMAQIGRLINGLGVLGNQLIRHSVPEHRRRASAILRTVKQQHEGLLRRLDGLARSSGDESALRLIEDLSGPAADIIRQLDLARRCLAASAFLGHCIVTLGARPALQDQNERFKQRLH